MPPPVRPALLPGFAVLGFYLLAGAGLWLFVLRSQPFPTVGATAEGGAARGGSQTLAQAPPPVQLPEDVKQRIAEFVDQAKAAPQNADAWRTLAEVQFRASQIDASYRSAALSSYQHVLELVPNDLTALRGVGNVYYVFKDYDKAKEYYEQYLALNPDDAGARTDLGTMYLYAKDAAGAIREYQTAVAKKPDFFQAYFNLGVAYHEKGDVDKARAALTRAKSLTTDKIVQERIDQVLASFGGEAGTASLTTPPPPTATAPVEPSLSPFQQVVEKLFRTHEIMGPRISRIEWPTPTQARILLQNFPMAGMPSEMRERFLEKFRSLLGEAKKASGITGAAKVEFIDADTQQLMETLRS